ncbi:hypothetical protein Acr_02g0011750 [Actinidia rufa]|uniref:Uncharacterized protein n=1 Tax=Actinidia rufa TaxID=165716 RepID=A0A7J0E979_9ERIC|nr:hypothetical protein Acr_02g0011750 [Actinidia rufa]
MSTDSSHHDGDQFIRGKTSSLSSSSSSASSFDPLLDLDDDEKDVLEIPTNTHGKNSPSRSEALKWPEVSPHNAEWSMISASPRSGPGPLSSPPIQAMGRPSSAYDPNRIPSSIFSSKPSTPTDWSVASNESLFSIHMGNNSFSRDHTSFLTKSGELIKLDEFNSSPSGLPTVMEVAGESHRKNDSMWEDSGVKEAAEEPAKRVVKEKAEDYVPPSAIKVSDGRETAHGDGGRNSASTARLSDESGNSSRSFAFPVFTGEGGRSSWVRVAPDCLQSKPPDKEESQPQAQAVSPKAAKTRCFLCKLGSIVDYVRQLLATVNLIFEYSR